MEAADIDKLDTLLSRLQREERDQYLQEARERRNSRANGKVVGGIYRPEPVDFKAAMLLAKAPWICKPPDRPTTPPKPAEPKPRRSKMPTTHKEAAAIARTAKMLGGGGQLLVQAMTEINNCEPDDAAKQLAEAKDRFEEASRALGQASHSFKTEMERLNVISAEALDSVRAKRYALLTETSKALEALREVRQFFIGVDYELERKRLAEFVELCERLKALKESGFLDAVGDTMLRLAIKA